MRDSVREAFVPFTVAFEGGYIGWMFPDVEGKVSTGFGLLLEPVAMALALPWRRPDGSLASRKEIIADWSNVKNHPNAARLGHKSVEHIARLRLDREGLYQAFQGKLGHHDEYLRHRFQDFAEWPADAQLGAHSMAWACGPAAWDASNQVGFPKMAAALAVQDFSRACAECHMNEWDNGVFNAGLVPRNAANKVLFRNAATVVAGGMDPDLLRWPVELSEEVTEPNLVPSRRPPVVADWPNVLALPDPLPLESTELDDDAPPRSSEK